MNALTRVLLLEEQKADAGLIEAELSSSGLRISLKQVENQKDFIRELRAFEPDIILSDYTTASFSGVLALEEAKKSCPGIPFIFVSCQIHEQSVMDVLKAGATDYVFKEQLSRLPLSVYRALREAEESRALAKAHAAMAKSEEYFRSLIENASDLILVLDGDAVVRYASPSVTKILGYDTGGFVGRSLGDFIHHEDRPNALAALGRDSQKMEFSYEFRFRHQDGSWRGLEAVGRLMAGDDGQPRIVLNARDITDRILEQEALRESIIRHLKTQTELQKTQQKIIQQERMAAIGHMASGIAHDFSNSLMPILGFSEILLNHPEAMKDLEKVRRYVEMINTSARDAMHIVGGLREFYRQKEKTENLIPFNLNKIVEQVVGLTQPKWKVESEAKGVTVTVAQRLGKLPDLIGNAASFREALTNLVFNATDAMPQGGELKFESRAEDDQIILEISDTGVGMSEEVRQRCFEPFFSTKGKGGTGLGLSMVYGVVRRHEGSIDVKSQEGKGTTVILRLPVKSVVQTGKAAPAQAEVSLTPSPEKSLNVLVVDDEPLVRDVLAEYLRGDGHTVTTAADGKEALAFFQKARFDLVITDRAMPEMNGDQLSLQIKSLSPATPVIMLTGFGELMKAKGERPQGVDFLLSKPLTFEAYRQAIARVAASPAGLP